MQRRSVISPALSDEEEEELRRRSEMSPSPEVDLSSHELDDDADATDSGSLVSAITTMIARQRTRSPSNVQHNVMASPPLEGDEREFSQSAIYIERRRSSSRESSSQDEGSSKRAREEEYESESIVSDELLGYPALSSSPTSLTPAKRAREEDKTPDKNAHHQFEDKADLYSWGGEFERHLGSPESVELDELDHLLGF